MFSLDTQHSKSENSALVILDFKQPTWSRGKSVGAFLVWVSKVKCNEATIQNICYSSSIIKGTLSILSHVVLIRTLGDSTIITFIYTRLSRRFSGSSRLNMLGIVSVLYPWPHWATMATPSRRARLEDSHDTMWRPFLCYSSTLDC